MRALVTGGTGFIGRATVRQLLDRGDRVRVFVRPSTARNVSRMQALAAAGDVEVVTGRLDDPRAVRVAMRHVEVVYHLAFLYDKAWQPGQELFRPNVLATTTLLAAARRADVRRVVWSGSVSVYGWSHPPGDFPLDEQVPLEGRGEYARTKRATEQLVRTYATPSRGEFVILRIPHVYGRGAETIEYFASRFVPRLDAAVRPIVDPTLSWGRAWHMVHVDDVARALALSGHLASARNATLNVAGPSAVSRIQFARIVRQRWREHLTGFEALRPAEGIRFQIFDTSAAARTLGFVPSVGIEEGLADMVDGLVERVRSTSPPSVRSGAIA